MEEEAYSDWSRQFVQSKIKALKHHRHPITQIMYHPKQTDRIFAKTENGFFHIDKKKVRDGRGGGEK